MLRKTLKRPPAPHCIAGLDISLTSTGLWLQPKDRDGRSAVFTTVPGDGTDWLRQCAILAGVRGWLADHVAGPCAVFVEDYTMGIKSGKNFARVELHGMLRLALQTAGYDVYIVPAATLKKHITGKGNASKEAMSQTVLARWGRLFQTEDECDAFCLSAYGAEYLWGNRRLGARKLAATL